jgi:hypothetical protein
VPGPDGDKFLSSTVSPLRVAEGTAALLNILLVPCFILGISLTVVGYILAGALCLMLTVTWTLLIWREYAYSRKARFAEAMADVHGAFHALRDACFALRTQQSEDTILTCLAESLRKLAAAFSLITGVHCRVCLKDVYCPDPNRRPMTRALQIRTVCRSEYTRSYDEKEDWVTDNTDFEELLRHPDTRYFICNNLPELKGYKNSHWTSETWDRADFPYVSTIVWPVRKRLQGSAPQVTPVGEKQECLGFLCVDSKGRGTFSERFDVWLGAAYSDALHGFWRQWKNMTDEPEDREGVSDG